MAGIEKDYYALEEVEERWGIPRRDLAYLAENGLLKVSVRLYGVRIERGSHEETDDGRWFSIPEEQTWFQGLQDLSPHDVYNPSARQTINAPPPMEWRDLPAIDFASIGTHRSSPSLSNSS